MKKGRLRGFFQLNTLSRGERGETFVGLLVATMIGALVIAGSASSFTFSMKTLSDRLIISDTNNHTRKIVHLIASDLRGIGSGMPLMSPRFDPSDPAIGAAGLPILTDSNRDQIRYRINEYGRFSSLSSTFNTATDSSISVLSTESVRPGSIIYISNITSEFSQSSTIGGARARVVNAGPTIISIDEVTSGAGSIFNPGSLVETVSEVSLSCTNPGGILRTSGVYSETLSKQGSCTFLYLDSSGGEIEPPLTIESIRSSLTSIRVLVSASGRRPLRSGITYTAQASETVALRNLILARNS
jgi:hypothetical protein